MSSADRFEISYRSGTPPWDIGRPQPEFVALAEAGAITGRVLDAGCGTGEHVLFLADGGLDVVGIDGSPTAIAQARAKAAERGIDTDLQVGDILGPGDIGTFDTIIDSGVFHVFDDAERDRYVASLTTLARPGALLHLMVFSEHETREGGPRRVTQDEIRDAFATGWTVTSIREAAFETLLGGPDVHAWLASLVRE